jgi:hypothetical protein
VTPDTFLREYYEAYGKSNVTIRLIDCRLWYEKPEVTLSTGQTVTGYHTAITHVHIRMNGGSRDH